MKRLAAISAGAVGLAASTFAVYNEVEKRVQDPLTVTAEPLSNGSCFPGYVIPGSAGDLGSVPAVFDPAEPPDARETWVRAHGGVNADVGSVEVIVQGNDDHAVILTGLTIDVSRRDPPMRGVNLAEPCGDAFWARYFEIDLDVSPPSVGPSVDQREEVSAGTEPPDPIDFPYTVSANSPERFMLIASTESCYCEWTATLHWLSGEEVGEVLITDDGDPFTVSATTDAPRYGNYDGGPLMPIGD